MIIKVSLIIMSLYGDRDDGDFEILKWLRQAMGHATRESLANPAEAHRIAQCAVEEAKRLCHQVRRRFSSGSLQNTFATELCEASPGTWLRQPIALSARGLAFGTDHQ